MAEVTADLAISLDGFAAGPNQTLDKPMGDGVDQKLHQWMFEQPEENAAELAALASPTAFIMGRNMFSPGRGPWDLAWTGWWGPEPPYHAPVFVLTHHPREPLQMEGTTFTFVTDGIHSAMEQARAAATDGHIGIAGGASTLRQYLQAGLVDQLNLHVVGHVLGAGERLFDGLDGLSLEPVSATGNSLVTHLSYRVRR
ncbi:dihydrofolate reductase [Nakamurella silvestris]|nr:dihydrofolate reductase [Nakamurella silvestris]